MKGELLMPYIIYFLLIYLWWILPAINKKRHQIILNNRRRGGKRMLPKELMQDFIGKVCAILTYNEIAGTTGKIVGVEENWLKVQTKKETKLINGDMVKDITIVAEKYQW